MRSKAPFEWIYEGPAGHDYKRNLYSALGTTFPSAASPYKAKPTPLHLTAAVLDHLSLTQPVSPRVCWRPEALCLVAPLISLGFRDAFSGTGFTGTASNWRVVGCIEYIKLCRSDPCLRPAAGQPWRFV